MTIQIELLNKDTNRTIEVIYRDDVLGDGGVSTASYSEAGIIEPGKFGEFYIHSTRALLIIEK